MKTYLKNRRPPVALLSMGAVGVRRDVQELGDFDESQRRHVQGHAYRYRVADSRERLRYSRSRSRERGEAHDFRHPGAGRGGSHDGSGRDRHTLDHADRYRVADSRERHRHERCRSRDRPTGRDYGYTRNWRSAPWDDSRRREQGGYDDSSGRDRDTWRDDGHKHDWRSAPWDDWRRHEQGRYDGSSRRDRHTWHDGYMSTRWSAEANRPPAWAIFRRVLRLQSCPFRSRSGNAVAGAWVQVTTLQSRGRLRMRRM